MAKKNKPKRVRQPAGPIPLTQEELEAKARGGRAAAPVTKRIRDAVPTKPLGRLKSKALAPATISREEMAAIVKSGRLAALVRKRLEQASAKDRSEPKKGGRKAAPKQAPPKR